MFSKHFYPFEGELDAAEWGTNSLDEKVDQENWRLQQQQPRCTKQWWEEANAELIDCPTQLVFTWIFIC